MDKPRLQMLADRGYFNRPEIKACAEVGITPKTRRAPSFSGSQSHRDERSEDR
jgi:hypothetical protein